MALQDKVQEATNEAKNALEAYVYALRNKMYGQLSEYVTDDFKDSTSRKLEQMEVVAVLLPAIPLTCSHLPVHVWMLHLQHHCLIVRITRPTRIEIPHSFLQSAP